MRLILYVVALLSTMPLFSQSFSDSTFMDVGVQYPRSEVVVYDRESVSASHRVASSRYIAYIDNWEHPSDNNLVFQSKFSRPFLWLGRQLFLRVASASAPYTLNVNGVEVGRVQNNSSFVEFNITKFTREGRNIVSITLDSNSVVADVEGWSREESTPTLGEVYVVSQPTEMIRDIAISTTLIDDNIQAEFSLAVKCYALGERTSAIYYSLNREDGSTVSFGSQNVTLSMRGEKNISFFAKIPRSEGWSTDNPQRFVLSIKTLYEGRFLEVHNYSVGIRSVEVDPQSGEMSINGESVTLTAKSVGLEFSPSDIDALKAEGYNTIRLAAGFVNREVYEAADQKGLYIIASTPINSSAASPEITRGGNPSNDPRWWGAYMQRMERSYHTVQIHPSVIAFSLAESSFNGYNLYEGYTMLKNKGDSRPVVYFESDGEWNTDKLLINIK